MLSVLGLPQPPLHLPPPPRVAPMKTMEGLFLRAVWNRLRMRAAATPCVTAGAGATSAPRARRARAPAPACPKNYQAVARLADLVHPVPLYISLHPPPP